MNHFISGIIKIVLLEGSIALLLIDRLLSEAPARYERARSYAFTVLAGLMVFAWANYGGLRGNVSWPYVMLALPLILLVGWLVRAAFRPAPQPRPAGEYDGLWGRVLRLGDALAPRLRKDKAVAVLVAVALVFTFVFVGVKTRAAPLVHQWEQFHFYLGAKYQKEVGWFDLYKAAILADRETVNAMRSVTKTRDLTNFEEVPVEQALQDGPRVRARFTPERWEAFKRDWTTMTQVWPMDWAATVNDHGNSNSPAWSLVAHPIAELLALSWQNQAFLGWLDMVLMLVMWLFVYETFGARAASVGLLMWATPPLVFDYLAGSFLRWDWLFALGMTACFLKRGRWATAGAFFGYAVATKLFPILFGVALLLRAGWEWRETKKLRKDWVQFTKGAALAGAVAVGGAALLFGPSAWPEYAQRIQVAQVEKFYAIQYSLKTVYLQVVESSPGELATGWLFPAELKQARPEVDIASHALGFLIVRLLFTAMIAVLLRRASDVEAFVMGPLLVFTWLTVNMYYWNMFGLLALGLALRKERPFLGLLLALHAIFMTFYLYQHLNRGFSEGYAVGFLLCVAIIGATYWEWREQQASAKVPASAKAPKSAKA